MYRSTHDLSYHTPRSRENGIYAEGKVEDLQNARKCFDRPRHLIIAKQAVHFNSEATYKHGSSKLVNMGERVN